jgi:hypothetical protein
MQGHGKLLVAGIIRPIGGFAGKAGGGFTRHLIGCMIRRATPFRLNITRPIRSKFDGWAGCASSRGLLFADTI